MRRGERLGNRRHADGVGPEYPGRANLRRRLEVRAGENLVHALVDGEAASLGAREREPPQSWRVQVADVEEARAVFVDVAFEIGKFLREPKNTYFAIVPMVGFEF